LPHVVDLRHVKDPWIYMEVGVTCKICRPFLARFIRSLTGASHVALRGAPLEMTEGTKGGAQRARSLRPRRIGELIPGPRRRSTIYKEYIKKNLWTHQSKVWYVEDYIERRTKSIDRKQKYYKFHQSTKTGLVQIRTSHSRP
jgi:hypothetical protein